MKTIFVAEPIPEDLNPELLKRYPELKAIAPATSKQDLLTPVRNG